MAFKPINIPRPRLADEAYAQIMHAIITGLIGRDERMVQEKLAEQLGISRTPIREALFRLLQEGVLEEAGRGGFKVRELSGKEIADIYGSRCAVEGYSARLLANNPTPELIDHLHSTISQAEQQAMQAAPTVANFFKANNTIHRVFVAATENAYLLELFDNIWNRGSSFTMFAAIENVDLTNSLGGHQVLIDAIATGDGNVAAEAMIAHIYDGQTLQVSAIQG